MGLLERLFGRKSPEYERWLLVSDEQSVVPWVAKNWRPLGCKLASLEELVEGPSRFTVQLRDEGGKSISPRRRVTPKDDGWCPKGTRLKNATIQLEAPGPEWCSDHGVWPHFYFEAVKTFSEHTSVAVHVAWTTEGSLGSYGRELLEILRQQLKPVFLARTTSRWNGLPESASIDAFLTIGFNYLGGHQERVPDPAKLEGEWEVVN